MTVERHRSGILTAGGILTVIAGALGLIFGVSLIIAAAGIAWWGWCSECSVETQQWFQVHGTAWMLAPAIINLILGGFALAGGISALTVKNWGWALAGAICALFTFFSLIFGLLGIIFIAVSKKDFATTQPS